MARKLVPGQVAALSSEDSMLRSSNGLFDQFRNALDDTAQKMAVLSD
jgi:hypothetical protein